MLKLIDFDNAVVFPGGLRDSMPASPIAFCCDAGRGHNHLSPECQRCGRISPAMDVYVVGQRLLNFFDNQRTNVYKQLGCVTSIYDTRNNNNKKNEAHRSGYNSSSSSGSTGVPPCDSREELDAINEVPLTSILRNGPAIEAAWPGLTALMSAALRLQPSARPTAAQL